VAVVRIDHVQPSLPRGRRFQTSDPFGGRIEGDRIEGDRIEGDRIEIVAESIKRGG
jgi:hypothetical protein